MLRDSGDLYIAPDAMLHLLPFGLLVDGSGKYLIQRYQFNYIGSGRDLRSFSKPKVSGDMYVFAAPDYNERKYLHTSLSQAPVATNKDRQVPLNIDPRARELRGKFRRLAGTIEEARSIQSLFKLTDEKIYFESRASENNLVLMQEPWRLHIATHGFFLGDFESVLGFDSELRSFLRMGLPKTHATHTLKKWQNPLLRSGIALAGANTTRDAGYPSHFYDGILTAYEISGMLLKNTDLVVLSACETGLGGVLSGEGVFGLRRAFQLAGAQTVVMSLWKVPDKDTKELMIDFYTRLKNDEGKSQALRNASLAMMRKHREQYGFAHPYYWGAFICAGNPN